MHANTTRPHRRAYACRASSRSSPRGPEEPQPRALRTARALAQRSLSLLICGTASSSRAASASLTSSAKVSDLRRLPASRTLSRKVKASRATSQRPWRPASSSIATIGATASGWASGCSCSGVQRELSTPSARAAARLTSSSSARRRATSSCGQPSSTTSWTQGAPSARMLASMEQLAFDTFEFSLRSISLRSAMGRQRMTASRPCLPPTTIFMAARVAANLTSSEVCVRSSTRRGQTTPILRNCIAGSAGLY
mmetsp:Transcript_7683/g.24407  ORF Transcript_7683/g.24407 Transcript_7683/m.24407 type:complete len:253 (-) Transcript_7683:759-1517(-)